MHEKRERDTHGRVLPICRQCVVYRGLRWELYDERTNRDGTDWVYIERGAKGSTEGLWVPAGATKRVRAKSLVPGKPRGKPFVKGDKRLRKSVPAAA